MPSLTERLMAKGWRMTAQRRVIFRVFDARAADDADANVHLTADEVLDRATSALPEISRATVYNTLNELVEAGELRAVNIGDRITRYDPNAHSRHDHLVCTSCGAILDVPTVTVQIPAAAAGFTIDSAETIYRGRCADCG